MRSNIMTPDGTTRRVNFPEEDNRRQLSELRQKLKSQSTVNYRNGGGRSNRNQGKLVNG
jgi:hypothetical protein